MKHALHKLDAVSRAARVHRLKSWPVLFQAICSGAKRHELRRNDREFEVGDLLELNEFDPDSGTYTGRVFTVRVTYITSVENPCALSDEALAPTHCIMSVGPM